MPHAQRHRATMRLRATTGAVAFVLGMLMLSLLADSSPARAQEASEVGEQDEWAAAFEAHFGRTPAARGRNVRRLRIAGWVLMGGALSAPFIQSFFPSDTTGDHDVTIPAVVGIAAGGTFILGSILLLSARLRVGRRRRWQNVHGGGDQGALEPESRWNVHLGATHAAFSLSF